MSEFPRAELAMIATVMESQAAKMGALSLHALVIREAIERYSELALRVCEDQARHSLEMAKKNDRIRELENSTNG